MDPVFRSPDSSAGRRDAGLERCTHAAKIGEKLENANRIGTNCPQVPLERSGGFVASSRPKLRGPRLHPRAGAVSLSRRSHALQDNLFLTITYPEYEDFPRGRIVYEIKTGRFIVYAHRLLQHEPVIARFGLAPGTFVVRSDAHYRSRRVLLKPPGRIRTQGQNEHQQQAEPGEGQFPPAIIPSNPAPQGGPHQEQR